MDLGSQDLEPEPGGGCGREHLRRDPGPRHWEPPKPHALSGHSYTAPHTHTQTHTHSLLSPHRHTIKAHITETHLNRHAAVKLGHTDTSHSQRHRLTHLPTPPHI